MSVALSVGLNAAADSAVRPCAFAKDCPARAKFRFTASAIATTSLIVSVFPLSSSDSSSSPGETLSGFVGLAIFVAGGGSEFCLDCAKEREV